VAAGVYAGFLWGCNNPNKGCRWPEYTDTDFIIEKALPYLGRFVSTGVNLAETSIKDCHKL
jgi:homospermidine synthase